MKMIKTILAYLLLILVWQILYILNVEIFEIWKSYSFPSPVGVVMSFERLIISGTLVSAVIVSVRRLIVGYVLSITLGALLGVVLAKFKFLRENYSSLFLGIQTMPSICWIPFAILWFGISEETILFVIMLGATTSMALATEAGIRNISPVYIKAAKNMGAKGLAFYGHIILPAATPMLIGGMKQSWSFAFRGLMAGEMLAASKGIGQVLMAGRDLADINQVAAVIIVIVFIGLLIDKLVFGKLENRVRKKWGLD